MDKTLMFFVTRTSMFGKIVLIEMENMSVVGQTSMIISCATHCDFELGFSMIRKCN